MPVSVFCIIMQICGFGALYQDWFFSKKYFSDVIYGRKMIKNNFLSGFIGKHADENGYDCRNFCPD